jgi:hypothetical protein
MCIYLMRADSTTIHLILSEWIVTKQPMVSTWLQRMWKYNSLHIGLPATKVLNLLLWNQVREIRASCQKTHNITPCDFKLSFLSWNIDHWTNIFISGTSSKFFALLENKKLYDCTSFYDIIFRVEMWKNFAVWNKWQDSNHCTLSSYPLRIITLDLSGKTYYFWESRKTAFHLPRYIKG